MYKYYQEYNNEEHMLFACEIAYAYNLYPQDFYDENVIITERIRIKKSIDMKIHKIMRGYIKKENIKYIPTFVQTSHGLKKVYPKYIYDSAIKSKIKEFY